MGPTTNQDTLRPPYMINTFSTLFHWGSSSLTMPKFHFSRKFGASDCLSCNSCPYNITFFANAWFKVISLNSCIQVLYWHPYYSLFSPRLLLNLFELWDAGTLQNLIGHPYFSSILAYILISLCSRMQVLCRTWFGIPISLQSSLTSYSLCALECKYSAELGWASLLLFSTRLLSFSFSSLRFFFLRGANKVSNPL